MVKFIPTICPYCGAGCGMLLVVRNGLLVGTKPWPRNPVSQGQLCIKGWNAHQFVHHEERLVKPLVKENGSFRESSWDEAVKLVADKLGESKSKNGADSIAFFSSAKCTNEENYLIQKFARAVIGTNNIDHCAHL